MGHHSKDCEIAFKCGLAGVTVQELAPVLEQSPRWNAVQCGRKGADTEIEQSLYRVLDGYAEEVERVVMQDGEPMIVRHTKRHAPKRVRLVRL